MILVVDVGTSSARAAVVDADARVVVEHRAPLLPDSPAPGLVEFDAAAMADAVHDLAQRALADGGPVDGVGIANQRASTIVWDRGTGVPVAPAIGWQDLRTVGRCLVLRAEGLVIAPNLSATKLEAILDAVDPDRERDLAFGTVDTWVAWNLSEGALHVIDASNAQVTALRSPANDGWDATRLGTLRIPERVLPAVVDSTGVAGAATALPGAPPIAGILGDQQASLLGQGCVHAGDAKITFGTGGMLDVVVGDEHPAFADRSRTGCFPIVTRRRGGRDTWGVEAAMLAAGTNVEWLRDDLHLITTAEESDAVAASCDDTGDVWYVPALLGLGTPHFDYGARGTLLGLTRGTGRAEVVRAVLEGIAHRGADLVDAAVTDTAVVIDALHVDGGMSANTTFVQALADATQRVVEVAPVREATMLGAAFAAGLALGVWSGDDEIAATWRPARRVEPRAPLDRDRWHEAVARATGWIPELSTIDV
ncbi:MAG TPA: FGGY-family carbohydrate kinase [Acidimicrobiia bacterium]